MQEEEEPEALDRVASETGDASPTDDLTNDLIFSALDETRNQEKKSKQWGQDVQSGARGLKDAAARDAIAHKGEEIEKEQEAAASGFVAAATSAAVTVGGSVVSDVDSETASGDPRTESEPIDAGATQVELLAEVQDGGGAVQEDVPEERTSPRPDRTESPLGEGIEELLAAQLTEVAQRAGDPELEAGYIPIPLPDVPEPMEEIDPRPIFREPEPVEVGMDPDPYSRDDLEGRSEVAPSFQFQVDEVSANPIPVPDVPEPLEMPVGAEVMNDPIPLPEPEPSELLVGAEDVSDIPIPAKIDSFTDSLSSTQFEMEEISSNPVPIPDPGLEDGFGDIGTLPVPVPNEIDPIPDVDMPIGLEEDGMEDFLDQG